MRPLIRRSEVNARKSIGMVAIVAERRRPCHRSLVPVGIDPPVPYSAPRTS